MTTITEDYVSFKTARLLKDKGFDEPTIGTYYKDGTFEYLSLNNWNSKFVTPISAPTLQMAMKWLREVHNLYIQTAVTSWPQKGYSVHVYTYNDHYNNFKDLSYVELMQSYEQAVDTAIRYCLENLI